LLYFPNLLKILKDFNVVFRSAEQIFRNSLREFLPRDLDPAGKEPEKSIKIKNKKIKKKNKKI